MQVTTHLQYMSVSSSFMYAMFVFSCCLCVNNRCIIYSITKHQSLLFVFWRSLIRPRGITLFLWSYVEHECIQRLFVDLHLHWPRAVFRRVHSSTIGYKLQHFLVTATWIWHVAQWEDLPQQNPKWPEKVRWLWGRGLVTGRERKAKNNQVINYKS